VTELSSENIAWAKESKVHHGMYGFNKKKNALVRICDGMGRTAILVMTGSPAAKEVTSTSYIL
jgi:hypothetical protein